MTHSYPHGYIPIADAWQEACSKLAPPESKPLENATFDDRDAYDAKVRIVERLMRSALADGILPVFVKAKNGKRNASSTAKNGAQRHSCLTTFLRLERIRA